MYIYLLVCYESRRFVYVLDHSSRFVTVRIGHNAYNGSGLIAKNLQSIRSTCKLEFSLSA